MRSEMTRSAARSIVLVVSIVSATFPWAVIRADDVVTVRLSDGHTLTGSIDSKTDARQLWLRMERATATARRAIAWDRITAARHAGQSIEVDDLRRMPAQGESPLRPQSPPPVAAEPVMSRRPNRTHRQRVRSMDAYAWAANWDADVENDGLVVEIRPLGERGGVVPVSGTLYVDLTLPTHRGAKFQRLARWTRAVRPADVGVDGIAFRLPYQARHPEFDTDLARAGLVHVRLVAAGHGSFERSVDGVRVRPFSPFRDDLQRATGGRFLPNERTGRGK